MYVYNSVRRLNASIIEAAINKSGILYIRELSDVIGVLIDTFMRQILSGSPRIVSPLCNPMMLKAAFLSCALILPALFAPAIAWQPDYGPMNIIIDNVQIPLGQHDYRLACDDISRSMSRSISPASEVFYPGTVVSFLSLSTAHCVVSQALLNLQKTSHIGSTPVRRYPRALCGLAQ